MSDTNVLVRFDDDSDNVEQMKMLKAVSDLVESIRGKGKYFDAVPENRRKYVLSLAAENHEYYASRFSFDEFVEKMCLNWLLKVYVFEAMCRSHQYFEVQSIVTEEACNDLHLVCLTTSASICWIGQNAFGEGSTKIIYVPIPFRGTLQKTESWSSKLAALPEVGNAVHFQNFPMVQHTSAIMKMYAKSAPQDAEHQENESEMVTATTCSFFKKIDIKTFGS